MSSELAARLPAIHARIESASQSVGKVSSEITIIAVTKTFPETIVREALLAGLIHIGESRVQEALTKVDSVRPNGIFHLIGHLQSNKVRKAVENFDWIQTLDDIEIAQKISSCAVDAGRTLQVLIEVNSSGESQKHGVSPVSTPALVDAVAALPNLSLRGLMTIGPLTESKSEITRAFDLTRSLFEHTRTQLGPMVDTLSMGMSDDFELAIRHSSTMIRLGSILFGIRPLRADHPEQ